MLAWPCAGQSRIQQLTSQREAAKAEKKLEKSARTSPSEAAATHKQIPGGVHRHSLGIGIGQTFVFGNFEDNGKSQITGDFLYAYSASYSFDLLANFHYSKHNFQGRYARLIDLSIGVKGRFFHFDSFSPFVVGGLGFYIPKLRRQEADGNLHPTKSQVVFGPHLGAGVDLRLNHHFAIGMLGQYHNPFDVKQEVGAEVEGSYFKLLLTVFYIF